MSREPGRLRGAIATLFGALTLGLLAASLLGLGARLHWICELFAHFAVQGAVAAGGLVIAWLAFRRPGRALACALAAGPHLSALAPEVAFAPEPVPDGLPRVRVVSANLLTTNTEHAAFLSWIRAERPDVVLALEVGRDWAEALETLADLYPLRRFAPREDNFGVGALALNPHATVEFIDCGPSDVPSLRVRQPVEGTVVTMVATHPIPPIGAARAFERDAQIVACAATLLRAPPPRILAGDLNATPWSPVLVDLRRGTGLRDSRAGFGLQTSWPNGLGVADVLFAIPIDHLLHDDAVAVVDRRLGPDVGSDHRPVVADFAVLAFSP
ncbi:endonuclease/exonuclease/phosphatase family protein [Myxococcota bacterium]|nr:endonuclease/exonuclease/phosphatase family protein [Myxococcota bacterium]